MLKLAPGKPGWQKVAEDEEQVDGMVHTECLEHSGGKAKRRRNSGANGPKTAKGSSRRLVN